MPTNYRIPCADPSLTKQLTIVGFGAVERKTVRRFKNDLIGVLLEDATGMVVEPPLGALLRGLDGSEFLVVNRPEHKPFVVVRAREKGSSLPKDHIELDMIPRSK